MTLKPLDILKKGFSKFTKTIKAHRDELNTKLARKETISSADEHWLDHKANTINNLEEHILETLESASDYDRGFDRLDEKGKAIVKRLREWAGDLAKAAGKKRNVWLFFSGVRHITECCCKGSEYFTDSFMIFSSLFLVYLSKPITCNNP
jgi:hypothetical protein